MSMQLNKVWSSINTCAAVIAGTCVELRYDCRTESINTPKSIRNIHKPTKIPLKRNCKKDQYNQASTVRLRNWTIPSPKQRMRQQLTINRNILSLPGQKCIPSFSFGSHLHQPFYRFFYVSDLTS